VQVEAVRILSIESGSVKLNLKIVTEFAKLTNNAIIGKLNDPQLSDIIGTTVIDLFTELSARISPSSFETMKSKKY